MKKRDTQKIHFGHSGHQNQRPSEKYLFCFENWEENSEIDLVIWFVNHPQKKWVQIFFSRMNVTLCALAMEM